MGEKKALENAIEFKLSGFSDLKLKKYKSSDYEDLIYERYLKQRRACWGGLSSTEISKLSLKKLEKEVFEFEKEYANTKIIDLKNNKLKPKKSIVKIFVEKYT